MEKSRNTVLTSPSKLSPVTKSSSFSQQQSKVSLNLGAKSPFTRAILSKSSSTPDAQVFLKKSSSLKNCENVKIPIRNKTDVSTSDSDSQPETPTKTTMPQFQVGLTPVRKLSYKMSPSGNLSDVSMATNITPSKENVQVSVKEKQNSELQLDDKFGVCDKQNQIRLDSEGKSDKVNRGDNVTSSETTEGKEKLQAYVTSNGTPKIPIDMCKLSSGTPQKPQGTNEKSDFKNKMANNLSGICSETSETNEENTPVPSVRTSKTSARTLNGLPGSETLTGTHEKEQETSKVSGDFSRMSETLSRTSEKFPETSKTVTERSETSTGTPIKTSVVTSKSLHGTSEISEKLSRTSEKFPGTSETMMEISETLKGTPIETSVVTSKLHGTSETSLKLSKKLSEKSDILTGSSEIMQGTSETSPKTSKTLAEKSETLPETSEVLPGISEPSSEAHGTVPRTPEVLSVPVTPSSVETSEKFRNRSKTLPVVSPASGEKAENLSLTLNISDNVIGKGNAQVEPSSKDTYSPTSFLDVLRSKEMEKQNNVNVSKHSFELENSVGRHGMVSVGGRNGIHTPKISKDLDLVTGSVDRLDVLGNSSPDSKSEKRQSSPGWKIFSRNKVVNKGSNKTSKFKNFFSPKDKGKKTPENSPKLKSKTLKLFGKKDQPEIWEIYDQDNSGSEGIHPIASEPDLKSANQVFVEISHNSSKVIHPVASEPVVVASESKTDLPECVYLASSEDEKITTDNSNLSQDWSETSQDEILSPQSVKVPSLLNLPEQSLSMGRKNDLDIQIGNPESSENPAAEKTGNQVESITKTSPVTPEYNFKVAQSQNSGSEIMTDIPIPKPPARRRSSKKSNNDLTLSPEKSIQEEENLQQTDLICLSNTQTPTTLTQTSQGLGLSLSSSQVESGINNEMYQNLQYSKFSGSKLSNISSSKCANDDTASTRSPIPSPRRRLRRKFSLEPRKLEEDEFIGFASLPEQVHRKAIKRGFEFSVMVVGETGLGKSTLINSLFLTDLYKDRKLPSVQDSVSRTVEISKKALEIEERGVKLRLTIVDTPGFNDAVNGEECWKNIMNYVDEQFEQYYKAESGLNRKNIQDTRVHCCLYFISPYGHGLKPMDVAVMKKLHKKCNIVPLVAKSDILTPKEVKRLKTRVLQEIEDNHIEIYQFPDCDSDEDEEFKDQDKALKAAIPFAVVGSNTVVEAGGKRIRGRMYPWGIVEVDNPSHCDFIKLRQMLISTHMQDLKDITSDVHYENYRAEHLASEMNKSQKERGRLKRDSVTNAESVGETEILLQQKEAEIQRMQAMLAKMQAQLQGSPAQQVNGKVPNT